ncbi:hypothetical protein CPC08DRAFT_757782 [Agrocybe pediades]|nr:hypothetical protein CPC08DRAFT_757782 [Agrocybe pediades]
MKNLVSLGERLESTTTETSLDGLTVECYAQDSYGRLHTQEGGMEETQFAEKQNASFPRRAESAHRRNASGDTIPPWLHDESTFPLPSKADSWEHCRKLTEEYDAEMCRTWKSELDYLLIFAGLFSATVTAFTIESYKWLQSDSDAYNARVLGLIYQQLNPTSGAEVLASITDTFPDGPVVRINACWFLSLILGLTTVLIGIVVAQWLREYERGVCLPSKDRLALRHMRYEGLVYWQVPRIVAYLPLLLQIAFILFLVGIIDLLWMLDRRVAIPASILVGFILLFFGLTVVQPAMQYILPFNMGLMMPQCAFKSPQSLGFLRILLLILRAVPQRWRVSDQTRWPTLFRLYKTNLYFTWADIDLIWRGMRDECDASSVGSSSISPDIIGALDWLTLTYHYTAQNAMSVLACIHQLPATAAVRIMRKISSRFSPYVPDILGSVGAQELPEDACRDIITVAFLRCCHKSNPLLLKVYWESQIRLMNTRSIPRSMVNWLPNELPINDLPLDTQLALLHSLNEMIKSDTASPGDIESTWHILRLLTLPNRANLEAPQARIDLMLELFHSLDLWLSCSGGLPREERLQLCVNPGIRQVLYEGFFDAWGHQTDYKHVVSLIQTLDKVLHQNPKVRDVLDQWSDCVGWTLLGP